VAVRCAVYGISFCFSKGCADQVWHAVLPACPNLSIYGESCAADAAASRGSSQLDRVLSPRWGGVSVAIGRVPVCVSQCAGGCWHLLLLLLLVLMPGGRLVRLNAVAVVAGAGTGEQCHLHVTCGGLKGEKGFHHTSITTLLLPTCRGPWPGGVLAVCYWPAAVEESGPWQRLFQLTAGKPQADWEGEIPSAALRQGAQLVLVSK
jgi:hypothetical protein